MIAKRIPPTQHGNARRIIIGTGVNLAFRLAVQRAEMAEPEVIVVGADNDFFIV